MGLHEVDIFLFQVALSVELKHLDEALRGLFDEGYVADATEELNAYLEVVEHFVDVVEDGLLVVFDCFVEPSEKVVQYVHCQLKAPFLLVLEHRSEQLLRLGQDLQLTQLSD